FPSRDSDAEPQLEHGVRGRDAEHLHGNDADAAARSRRAHERLAGLEGVRRPAAVTHFFSVFRDPKFFLKIFGACCPRSAMRATMKMSPSFVAVGTAVLVASSAACTSSDQQSTMCVGANVVANEAN